MLSDFDPENVTLTVDSLHQVVESLNGYAPTVLEIDFMCWFRSLGRILRQCSVSRNLVDPVKDPVDNEKVEVGI